MGGDGWPGAGASARNGEIAFSLARFMVGEVEEGERMCMPPLWRA